MNDPERRLLEALNQIPWAAWEHIVREEPEWQTMYPFLEPYTYGPFAVLMLVTGLNDYQLKGRAEIAYWPPIGKILAAAPPPSAPEQLILLLEPFYREERYGENKVRRLRVFLSSQLAKMLWELTPEQVSAILPYIWRRLGNTMRQELEAKTIVFAMKCLGLSLLMAGVITFDFSQIPIPVDIRVTRFTQRLGLAADDSPEVIRKIWDRILTLLQERYPGLTMIHLDSLVWQVAAMNERQVRAYFRRIGAPEAGEKLCTLLQRRPVTKPVETGKSTFPRASNVSRGQKVICFIPCCGSKAATGKVAAPAKHLGKADLPNTWANLSRGREEMGYCMDRGSLKTSALYLYTGSPYEAFAAQKDEIAKLLQDSNFRLIIISAGYGILDALEPACRYDAVLQGKVAAHWKKQNLSGIIADLLLKERPTKVYGFFAGTSAWSAQGSKYRYFFSEGVRTAIEKGLQAEAGCFYRAEGYGVKAILGGLGRTFSELLEYGFDDGYVQNVKRNMRKDGGVLIGFEQIQT